MRLSSMDKYHNLYLLGQVESYSLQHIKDKGGNSTLTFRLITVVPNSDKHKEQQVPVLFKGLLYQDYS